VAAGFACSAAVTLTAAGATDIYTWGANDFGVLGHGVVGGPDQLVPKKVCPLSLFKNKKNSLKL